MPLKGVPFCISPELLCVLSAAGHGDEIRKFDHCVHIIHREFLPRCANKTKEILMLTYILIMELGPEVPTGILFNAK